MTAGNAIPAHQRLELEFGRWCGNEDVVACSSGTAALHLALEALKLTPGAEVIVPDFTMVACARAVVLAGLTPVFVDCGDDLLIDPKLIEAAIDPDKTVAVMPVHVYGRRCAMQEIHTIAADEGLFVVEDMAELADVRPHQDTDAACWSFYRNKLVAGEEGGAVAFQDGNHAKLARQLRSLGFTAAHDYRHVPRGHNYRLADTLAELVLASLKKADDNRKARRALESQYRRHCPAEWMMPSRQSPWVFDVRIPGLTDEKQTEIVRTVQSALGLAARHAFKPMTTLPEFLDSRRVEGDNAVRASREVVYLPLTPGEVTEDQAARVFPLVKSLL